MAKNKKNQVKREVRSLERDFSKMRSGEKAVDKVVRETVQEVKEALNAINAI